MKNIKDRQTYMLKIGSEATQSNAASILALEENVARNSTAHLILDLQDTVQLDTYALSTLIAIRQRLNKYGGDLGIINLTPPIRTLLFLTRTVQVLPTYRDAEHASHAMAGV